MSRDDERMAAALRENLRRRKAQSRGRVEPPPPPAKPAAADADSIDSTELPARPAID